MMKQVQSSIFDGDALSITLGSTDSDVLIGFYEIFVTHTCSTWRAVCQAATNGLWQDVASHSHSLKSSSSSVGADALSLELARLERSAHDLSSEELLNIIGKISILLDETIYEINKRLDFLKSQYSS